MHEEDNRENHGRGPIDLGAERSWEGRTATAVAKVERFVSGLFTLTSLDEAKAMMPSLPGSTGGQARRGYSRAFDEDNPSKQPLLVKNSFDATPTNVARRQPSFSRSSWKNSLAAAAEEERQQAAEARGSGYYSLHAVIGQGSFGRIHLTSWRTEEEQSALLSSPPPVSSSSIERRSTDPARATRPCRGAGRSRTESAGSIREISTLPSYASDGRLGSPDRRGNPGRQTSSNDAALNVAGLGRAGSRRGDGPSLPSHSRRHSENSETLDTRCYEPERMFDDEREWVGNERWEDGHGEEEPDPRLRALKSVCKRKVTEKGLVRHVETELAVLKQCSHPFIVALSPGGQFQTSRHLHLVLDYCPGGDLFSLLGRQGRLTEPQAKVCAAQLALALRHLHQRHIVYRDLKPENVCLDKRGQAILVDFSLARTGLDRMPDGKAFTFCGSAAYAAPEMIARGGHDTRVDLWSLGCVLFEALVGAHPFRRPRGERSDRQALFERIQRSQPDYPQHLSASALSFLQGLLVVDPNERLRFASQSPPWEGSPGEDAVARRLQSTEVLTAVPASPPTTSTFTNVSMSDPTVTACESKDKRRNAGCSETEQDRADAGEEGNDVTITLQNRTSEGRQLAGPDGKSSKGVTVPSTLQTSVRKPSLLLQHRFFRGLPGWGGPGTGGAWEDTKLEGLAVVVPELRNALDVQYFDPRFTTQPVELVLQGHPHKGGPTATFDDFEWRADDCIEYAQVEERRAPGFLGSMASAFWC